MLVQKERGRILQTYHQMGLCRQEGAPFNAIVHWEGIEAVPASPTYPTAGSAAPACQKDIWYESLTCKPTQYLPTPWQSRKEIHSGSHGGITLSRMSGWLDDARCTQHICNWTCHTYRKEDAMMLSTFRLVCSITRRRNCHLPSKQYETRNTQQRIVSIWTQGPKQSQWPHVHGRLRGHSHQQWGSTQNLQIIRAVMSSAVEAILGTLFINPITGVSIQHTFKKMDICTIAPPSKPTIQLPTHYSQKKLCPRCWGHGHEIPLVALLQSTGPVLFLQETWNTEFLRITGPSIIQPAITRFSRHKSQRHPPLTMRQ